MRECVFGCKSVCVCLHLISANQLTPFKARPTVPKPMPPTVWETMFCTWHAVMCVRTHVQVCVHKCVPEILCAFTCACWGTYIVTHVASNAGATVRIVHTLPYFDHEVKVLLRNLYLRGGISAWEGEQSDHTCTHGTKHGKADNIWKEKNHSLTGGRACQGLEHESSSIRPRGNTSLLG